MNSISQTQSLSGLVKGRPLDADAVEQFRQGASAVLQHAYDVFSKADRSQADAQQVVPQLKDLEQAVKLCADGRSAVHSQNLQAAQKACGEKGFLGFNYYADDGTGKFIQDVHQVAGLFACLGALTGPVSLTVGNFAGEHAESSFQADSSSDASERGLFHHGEASSQSHAEGASEYDKTSTDERVLPMLLDLEDRVAQAKLAEAQTVAPQVAQEVVHEAPHVGLAQRAWGALSGNPVEKTWTETVYKDGQKMPGDPAHLVFPDSGTSNYERKPDSNAFVPPPPLIYV